MVLFRNIVVWFFLKNINLGFTRWVIKCLQIHCPYTWSGSNSEIPFQIVLVSKNKMYLVQPFRVKWKKLCQFSLNIQGSTIRQIIEKNILIRQRYFIPVWKSLSCSQCKIFRNYSLSQSSPEDLNFLYDCMDVSGHKTLETFSVTLQPHLKRTACLHSLCVKVLRPQWVKIQLQLKSNQTE